MKNRNFFYFLFLIFFMTSFYIFFLSKEAKAGQIYAVNGINFTGRVLPLSAVWHKIKQKTVPLNIMTYATKKAYLKAMTVNGSIYFRLKWYDPHPVFKIISPKEVKHFKKIRYNIYSLEKASFSKYLP